MDEQLSKYISGELPTDQLTEFFERVENNVNLKAEFIKLQNINALSVTSPYPMDREEGIKNYKPFESRVKQQNRKTILVNVLKYTAIVLLVVTSTVLSDSVAFRLIAISSLLQPANFANFSRKGSRP